MNDKDTILQDYIHKMYDLQTNRKDEVLTTNDLKQIALDTGMSEKEWAETQQIFEAHLKKGSGHTMHKNWQEAYKEFQQASVINPYSIDAVFGLANSSTELWKQTGNNTYRETATEMVDRCQQISPAHAPSLGLMSKINSHKQSITTGKKSEKRIQILALVVIIVLGIIWFATVRNNVVELKMNTDEKWAQVENVCLRRADLIPDLVKAVKSASEFEQSTLLQLVEARENAINASSTPEGNSAESREKFIEAQAQLSAAFKQFTITAENYPQLQSLEMYKTLMVQMEGSENRISVERRRYNEAVKEYNTYVLKFPVSILGNDPLPFFEVDKKDTEKPEVDL